MAHAVVEHCVQAAVHHGEDGYGHAKQQPALRVPGLAPRYQHPEQAAEHGEHRSGTIA